MNKPFCVVGSLNMDLVTRVQNFPLPGETIRGESFRIFPGGKGANQAVALARLGARVEMVGAIGSDMLGSSYKNIMNTEGINTGALAVVDNQPTGTASIEVTLSGQNHIIVVGGANNAVTEAFVLERKAVIEKACFLLLQLEIPLEANIRAASIAREKGIPVMLDPAPATRLPPELLSLINYLTPNEMEAALLTNTDTSSEDGIRKAACILQQSGVEHVVIKAGKRGAYITNNGNIKVFPSYQVEVIDTVAAGDSFNAGLAFALGSGKALEESIGWANAVAALSVTKEGAQSAMPSLMEVEALIKSDLKPGL